MSKVRKLDLFSTGWGPEGVWCIMIPYRELTTRHQQKRTAECLRPSAHVARSISSRIYGPKFIRIYSRATARHEMIIILSGKHFTIASNITLQLYSTNHLGGDKSNISRINYGKYPQYLVVFAILDDDYHRNECYLLLSSAPVTT
jgi:hypothetical protein